MNEIIYALDRSMLAGTSRKRFVEMAHEAGFDGIEIPVHSSFLDSSDSAAIEELLSLLYSAKLTAPSMAILRPSAVEEAEIAELRRTMHALEPLARAAGVRMIILRIESDAQVPHEQALKTLSGSLIAAYNHFDPLGIAVAVELCEEGLLGSYSEAMDWLYLHNPEAGVAIDARSLAGAEASPYRAMVEMGRLVRMAYLSEPLASSRFYYSHLFSGMKAIDYKGPLALRQTMTAGATLADTVTNIRKLWTLSPVEQAAVIES